MRRHLVLFAIFCLLVPAAIARKHSRSEDAAKNGSNHGKLVDSGTFAVFQNGQKVATETFSIHQFPSYSVTSSKIRFETGQANKVREQEAELTLQPNGSLKRYEFTEDSPVHRTLTVEPSENILLMHSNVDGKKKDQPFFLSPSDFVLDDYFFSTREVLLWRYQAMCCKPRASGGMCNFVRRRFPVLIPQRNTSSQVYLQFKGIDDMPMNGRPQHLRHFVMDTDGPTWNLWVNDNQKLLRISIPAEHVEILRQ